MSSRPKPTLTAADLYRLSDDDDRLELVRGYLVREPPVGERHGRVVTRITFFLEEWSMRTGNGVVLTGDVGFVLARSPDTVRAPDVAVLARRPRTDSPPTFHEGPPDLAVEVLSPGDRPQRLQAKLDDYWQAGVLLTWIVDPAAREVRIFQPPEPDQVLACGDVLTAPDVLPGFSVPVADLFLS